MALLNDLEVEDYLKSCVTIEPSVLQEEFIRVPADIAYWNEKYSVALRAHLLSKIDCEKRYAQLQITYREKLSVEGHKVTEALVTAHIESDENYIGSRERMVYAEIEKARLGGIIDAVRAKRDMIISLGAFQRIELQSDPVLREKIRGQRVREGGDGF